MEKLTVTLKTVTPMFLGGAELDRPAELRAPSIKGAMRFWYRAIDPEYNQKVDPSKKNSPTWEEKIFGSANYGRGIFFIRLENNHIKGDKEWNHANYPNKHGVRYLSFSMCMGRKRRKYITPNIDMGLTITFNHSPEDKEKKAILASLWLLGHIGGLGSRSRRGLGTVALQSWNCKWDKGKDLLIAHNAESVDDWWNVFSAGLNVLKGWFTTPTTPDHSVFGKNTKFFLFEKGNKEWQVALDEAGLVMQKFRDHWDVNDKNSDYHRVKAHLGVDPRIKQNPLKDSPERAAFGLPLTFRYKELDNKGKPIRNVKDDKIKYKNITFEGSIHERSASPIHIRIVQIGKEYYPFYIRLDFENNEKKKDQYGTVYKSPIGNILDTFWCELKKKNNGKEKLWK